MKKLWWVLILLMLIALLVLFGARPFLAVNQPVKANVLILEGWVDERNLPSVADLATADDIQLITTGTFRPCAYYLRGGQGIRINSNSPVDHHVAIEAAGVTGAVLFLTNDLNDTLLAMRMLGEVKTFHANFNTSTSQFRLSAYHPSVEGTTTDVVFIREVLLGDSPAHSIAEISILDSDGAESPGTPTHAHYAAARLVELGIPQQRIHIAPGMIGEGGRTNSNAKAAAEVIRRLQASSTNVISEGVHSRRSWNAYRDAIGDVVNVGIIALPDLECEDPWTSIPCWRKLGKELLGMSRY